MDDLVALVSSHTFIRTTACCMLRRSVRGRVNSISRVARGAREVFNESAL